MTYSIGSNFLRYFLKDLNFNKTFFQKFSSLRITSSCISLMWNHICLKKSFN